MADTKQHVVEITRRLLAKMGYRLQSLEISKPIALPSFDGDPSSLRYLNRDRTYLITGKVKDGRGLLIFPLDANGDHPFVKSVKKAMEAAGEVEEKNTIKAMLLDFSSRYQPGCATGVLGLSARDVPKLGEQPPWAVIKPWENLTLEQRIRKIHKTEMIDNRQALNVELSLEHGCNFCGPVSDKKLEVEVERLHGVMRSIRKNGFVRHDYDDGDVRADILVDDDGHWRWLVKTGHHRAAALSAFGFLTLPIRADTIVCREEVELWPQVISGTYSRQVALQVFDNIFHGVGLCGKCEEPVARVC
jgi:hypothetical protein